MSIGTNRLSDSSELVYFINKLSSTGSILVAALNNDYSITLPASMKNVIGVIHDFTNKLEPNKIYYTKENIFSVQCIVNSINAIDNEDFVPSNSFAVPIVVASIMNFINNTCVGGDVIRNYFSSNKNVISLYDCIDAFRILNSNTIVSA